MSFLQREKEKFISMIIRENFKFHIIYEVDQESYNLSYRYILTLVISLSAERLLHTAFPTSEDSLLRLRDFFCGLTMSCEIVMVEKQ